MLETQGLIMDWGGVMTIPVDAAITDWLGREQIDREVFDEAVRDWIATADGPESPHSGPIAELELGSSARDRYEVILADRPRFLSGKPVPSRSLLQRTFDPTPSHGVPRPEE